jgi:hypothetical protein
MKPKRLYNNIRLWMIPSFRGKTDYLRNHSLLGYIIKESSINKRFNTVGI